MKCFTLPVTLLTELYWSLTKGTMKHYSHYIMLHYIQLTFFVCVMPYIEKKKLHLIDLFFIFYIHCLWSDHHKFLFIKYSLFFACRVVSSRDTVKKDLFTNTWQQLELTTVFPSKLSTYVKYMIMTWFCFTQYFA